MIITVSGRIGSGKSTISKDIAARLNLKHYSIGDFMREIAEKKGVSLMELSKTAEKSREIDEELDRRTKELGEKETNFIIDSRIGFHFIPDSIKIFLDVSLDEGARRVFNDKTRREKENLTMEKTKESIMRREKSELERYEKYYGITDPYDSSNYDFVIDTTNKSVHDVIREIIEKITSKRFVI